VNISFLTEKLPYFQIFGTKVGKSYKNGVIGIIQSISLGSPGTGPCFTMTSSPTFNKKNKIQIETEIPK